MIQDAFADRFVPTADGLTIYLRDYAPLEPSSGLPMLCLHGLTRTLVANAVQGVSEGYSREMSIKGIGYRAKLSGKNLELSVGYSHPVVVEPPQGIVFEVPEPTKIFIRGIDKQLVGQVAANVRGIRKPSAYHEKGIYYAGEPIKLKPGKAGSK